MTDQPTISVFGSGDPLPGSEAYELAREVGGVLAGLGYAIANGGYGGTMEASATGAHEAGGYTIAVPCSIWSSAVDTSIFSEVHPTHSYDERLATLIALGSGGYVALPGGTGTLVELAWVWEHACKGFFKRAKQSADGVQPPIVCVGEFWQPLVDMMVSQRPRSAETIQLVTEAADLTSVFPQIRGNR